jgi:hypothetical protein
MGEGVVAEQPLSRTCTWKAVSGDGYSEGTSFALETLPHCWGRLGNSGSAPITAGAEAELRYANARYTVKTIS